MIVTVRTGEPPPYPQPAHDGGGRRRPTTPVGCGVVFFNQPWLKPDRLQSPAREMVVFGKAETYRGRAADDQSRASTSIGDQDRSGSCPCTRSPRRPGSPLVGHRGSWIDEIVAPIHPAGTSPTRSRPSIRARPSRTSSAATAALRLHPPPRRPWADNDQRPGKRLVFDELLRVQLALVHAQARSWRRSVTGTHVTSSTGALVEALLRAAAPDYPLTGAPGARHRGDPRPTWPHEQPMHRLLQGDVGCGQDDRRGERPCSPRWRVATRPR